MYKNETNTVVYLLIVCGNCLKKSGHSADIPTVPIHRCSDEDKIAGVYKKHCVHTKVMHCLTR